MEPLKHECGVAMVRLRKPLSYYQEKYGTWRYGLNKMYLLMEKQHNRGQDGAGIACAKLTAPPGEEYMYRERAEGNTAIARIFMQVEEKIEAFTEAEQKDANFAQAHIPFAAECYMGHLRYRTQGSGGWNLYTLCSGAVIGVPRAWLCVATLLLPPWKMCSSPYLQ